MSFCVLNSHRHNSTLFQLVAGFLGLGGISLAERTCKLWNKFCSDRDIWIGLSKKEGIPLVQGEARDRKADFKTLYPMTISGKRISRLFGEIVGEIPYISEVIFSVLNAPDPFEEEKLMKDTFVFVVDPGLIRRTASVATPLDLNAEGNLIELPINQVTSGKELLVPFSFRNLRALSSHPLKGREHLPVFEEDPENKIFEQCGASSNKIGVYFMRRTIAEESRGMVYDEQAELVGGFDVTHIRIRALFDAVLILESGTCPDNSNPKRTYVRCSDTVYIDGDSEDSDEYVWHVDFGSFIPHSGLRVRSFDYGLNSIGVVPGVQAEAL